MLKSRVQVLMNYYHKYVKEEEVDDAMLKFELAMINDSELSYRARQRSFDYE